MNTAEITELILKAYARYYDIKREDIPAPFVAEAVFHSNNEQYFLIKSAKISEQESNEYVFFANADSLSREELLRLDQSAWDEGSSRVNPHSNHRNSDVTLIVVAQQVSKEASDCARKLRHYQSYKMGLHGWSNYRVIILENSTGSLTTNRQGQNLKKLFRNIIKNNQR